MSIETDVVKTAKQAQKASRYLSHASAKEKNNALAKMADGLLKKTASILKENKKEIEIAKKAKK